MCRHVQLAMMILKPLETPLPRSRCAGMSSSPRVKLKGVDGVVSQARLVTGMDIAARTR